MGGAERRRDGRAALLLPALLVLAVVFFLPIVGLIAQSFHLSTGPAQLDDAWTLANYRGFLVDPFYWRLLRDTAVLGVTVVALCLIIAYPLAYFLARTRSRWRGALFFVVVSPLLISAVVRNLGWFPILSNEGLLHWLLGGLALYRGSLDLTNSFAAVTVALVHALVPFLILTLTVAIQRVEREVEEAAINLGAGPLETFLKVTLPLTRPGLVGGCLLVFTMAISAYTTPALMGGNRVMVMAIYIAQQMRSVLDYGAGATAAAVLMLLAALLTFVALRVRAAGGGR